MPKKIQVVVEAKNAFDMRLVAIIIIAVVIFILLTIIIIKWRRWKKQYSSQPL